METTRFVDAVRADLEAAAAVGGPALVEAAGRLSAALDASMRLALLDALSEASMELGRQLASRPHRGAPGRAARSSSPTSPTRPRRRRRRTTRRPASPCACRSGSRPTPRRRPPATACPPTPGSCAPSRRGRTAPGRTPAARLRRRMRGDAMSAMYNLRLPASERAKLTPARTREPRAQPRETSSARPRPTHDGRPPPPRRERQPRPPPVRLRPGVNRGEPAMATHHTPDGLRLQAAASPPDAARSTTADTTETVVEAAAA